MIKFLYYIFSAALIVLGSKVWLDPVSLGWLFPVENSIAIVIATVCALLVSAIVVYCTSRVYPRSRLIDWGVAVYLLIAIVGAGLLLTNSRLLTEASDLSPTLFGMMMMFAGSLLAWTTLCKRMPAW